MDNFRLGFREVIPDQTLPETWKEITLNTGGSQSTLQDIKLPERAGGYFYKDGSKVYTRNRFISWRVSQDSLEVVERSLELRICGGRVRWRGGGALIAASVHELSGHVLLLAASVGSVHRFVFPHPDVIHKQEEELGRDLEDGTSSILSEATATQASDPRHFHIISHYANANSGAPHTCAMGVLSSGEALYALAGCGAGGGGSGSGVLLVRLSPSGAAHTTLLRQESIVPRFFSALRGNRNEGDITCALALVPGKADNGSSSWLYALGRDTRLRVWCLEKNTCVHVHSLLPDNTDTLTQGAQSHMLRLGETSSGEPLLAAFLCFATGSHFIVLKPTHEDQNAVNFARICYLFGPERDLVDFGVMGGGLWAAWGDGITGAALAQPEWRRAPSAPAPPPEPPQCLTHSAYAERLFSPGLFPIAVIAKALSIYERSSDALNASSREQSVLEVGGDGGEGVRTLRGRAEAAARAAEQRHAARGQLTPEELMHKCWTELYSWCVQYLEVWRKPLGVVLSNHENGGWCVMLRRGGVSFLRPMDLLEHLFLSEDDADVLPGIISSHALPSTEVCSLVILAGSVARRTGPTVLEDVKAGLLQEVADQLLADTEVFPSAFIDSLSSKISAMSDLPGALIALNEALRLDCEEIEEDEEECRDLTSVFSSDMGVSLATESLRQMAELRFSICCNLQILGAVLGGGAGGGSWPVAGHTSVSLQAYNALAWLCDTTLPEPTDHHALKSGMERLSLLRVADSGAGSAGSGRAASVAWWFARGAGGRAARRLLAAQPPGMHWSAALGLYVHCLGHLMWGVSGGFTLGEWLAGTGRPRLLQSYTKLLAPWCEWNSCSREFIVGMSLLDTGEPRAALASFLSAGKRATSEPFLARLLPPHPHSPKHALLNYYLKVIKLFELHKTPECIISLAETAIGIADKDDPHLPVFHSLLFNTWVSLEAWERALACATAHPASEQREACLSRLAGALGAARALRCLLGPGAAPPPPPLIRAAERRARAADAPHNHYYNFLYAVHIRKGDMRKAAEVMYEQAGRIATELGPSAEALGRRARCLLGAANCLALVAPRHAYLVTPLHAAQSPGKRDNKGEVVPPEREVLVVGLEELRRELHLLTARLKFANTQPDKLCPENGVEEVASLLSGVGLHSAALGLRARLGAPRAPALAALASACATLSTAEEPEAETEAWRWLAENDIAELCVGERSASGATWRLLQSLVTSATRDEEGALSHCGESKSSIYHAVAGRLLAAGAFLPHWLLTQYKELDASSLVRLLTQYGRLLEAASVGLEALRACTPAPAPLPGACRPALAPLPALDSLMLELEYQANLGDKKYAQCHKELEEVIQLHCQKVQRAWENVREIHAT